MIIYNIPSRNSIINGGDRVVISASHLAEKTGIELQLVIDHGADIAQKCSNKFATGPQVQYDWIVVFETETQSFVAISRRIARNALGRK